MFKLTWRATNACRRAMASSQTAAGWLGPPSEVASLCKSNLTRRSLHFPIVTLVSHWKAVGTLVTSARAVTLLLRLLLSSCWSQRSAHFWNVMNSKSAPISTDLNSFFIQEAFFVSCSSVFVLICLSRKPLLVGINS